MIRITEKDLFTFVFYSDNLSKEKRNLINSNLDKFINELDLLKDIKVGLKEPLPKSILERVHKKIENFENKNVYLLEKIETVSNSEYLILAADSPEKITSPKTETYVDSNNKFMCKVISTNETNKIYIFSNLDDEDLEFDITIFPSKENYIVNKTDMPIVLSPKQIINQMKLRIVN
jgi:hypothetical protein